ncbi:hypothetical protein CJU90_4167 [Yarrowia sp. C11]|nr:hypothetical protein CKK34_6783 [Yarrowia sp. E02]KAG5365109.1 hypothetical protein CJU90_4167 [Yarrowia sp. C11]
MLNLMRPALRLRPSVYAAPRLSARSLHTTGVLRQFNNFDPSDELQPRITKVIDPDNQTAGPFNYRLFKIADEPLYSAPATFQVALAKKSAFTLGLIGTYASYLFFHYPLLPDLGGYIALGLWLPFPLATHYLAPYVSKVSRIYRRGEPETLENMTKNETVLIETISLLGRKPMSWIIPLRDLKVVNKRSGWANWEYTNPKTGDQHVFYVSESTGGFKMDRIWGITERNAGIDSGR